jgi:hypothetical protein
MIGPMTEADWMAGNFFFPSRLLNFLEKQGMASDRKCRLFGVACCRAFWHLFTDDRCRKAVELAEAFADGVADQEHLLKAAADAQALAEALVKDDPCLRNTTGLHAAACAADETGREMASSAFSMAPQYLVHSIPRVSWAFSREEIKKGFPVLMADYQRHLGPVARCMFGNPFRPTKSDETCVLWNEGTIFKFAQAIYQDRAFDRLPILADALEDAGCHNTDILAHCRGRGPHVRGCWVVDLLLGKE